MSLSFTGETVTVLGNTQADCKVARPWPENRGVGERNIQMLAITRDIWMPDRLRVIQREGSVITPHPNTSREHDCFENENAIH